MLTKAVRLVRCSLGNDEFNLKNFDKAVEYYAEVKSLTHASAAGWAVGRALTLVPS